jgi:hypothetical protein
MDYLDLAVGIFCGTVGLLGLAILLWQFTRSNQGETIIRTAALGRGSLSLALLLLGVNGILRYYMIGNSDIRSTLSLVAIFCSLTALVFLLRSQVEQRNNKM